MTFTAYFDASGDKGTTALTMAGFVSRVDQWERFRLKWASLLQENSKVTHFHMTDFVNSKNGWGDWKGKSESERRAIFFSKLVNCVKGSTNVGIASTVILSDFEKVDQEYKFREEFGNPYVLMGTACLGRLKKWAKHKNVDYRKVLCIFEDGDEGQYDLISRSRKDGFNAITQSKRHIREFDACDLVAWKARSALADAFVRNLHLQDPNAAARVMESLRLIETAVQYNEMLSRNGMLKACFTRKLAKRTGK